MRMLAVATLQGDDLIVLVLAGPEQVIPPSSPEQGRTTAPLDQVVPPAVTQLVRVFAAEQLVIPLEADDLIATACALQEIVLWCSFNPLERAS
jgi:hypothetical protein